MSENADPPDAGEARAVLTWRGCLRGAQLMLPVLPGLIVYALAFGAASSQRGLSLGQSVSMSAFVYAGASQMLSLEIWRDVWSPLLVLTVAIVTATVNARFVLMGAAFQPAMRGVPAVPTALGLFFLVDASWIIATRDREEGGRDLGVLFGAGIMSWIAWVIATVPGYVAGSLVSDPRRYALDLVMPIFFGAMAAPLWRGAVVSGLPWLVSALVALAVGALVPGYAFIVAGALAGALTGALRGPR